jgi:eukaryotic-like serine/threonine-protein kinase
MTASRKSNPSTTRRTRSRYTLLHKVGDGGMGIVYAALDNRLRRQVALKFAPARLSVGASAALLVHEAEAMARVRSPHVCQVHDVDEHDRRPCLVLELLEGSDLKRYLAGRAMTTPAIVRSSLQIAEALEATHAAGLVHQDIKPANLFVTATGDIKILDFGLAIDLLAPTPPVPMSADARDSLYGTVNYIAPERLLRQAPTPQSDLFSLGAVMYEMATGHRPFTGATSGETILNILDYEPLSIRQFVYDRPAALDAIVRRLLAKDANRRFRTAGALGAALQSLHLRRPAASRPNPTIAAIKGDCHAAIDRRAAAERHCA